MNDLDLLRRAVAENVLEDAPLAALVDVLTEAGEEWEASVRRWELEERRKQPYRELNLRNIVTMFLILGPEKVTGMAEFGKWTGMTGT